MNLFDDIARPELGYKSYAEPESKYLNRSGRRDLGIVRAELESWFARYPEKHKPDLWSRFRSGDEWAHRAAFFELFLHELLLRLDCTVEVHAAPVEGSSTRPDFLVQAPASPSFYLEATVPRFESHTETNAESRMQPVRDAVNELSFPGYLVGMEVTAEPATPPSATGIKRFLVNCFERLDPRTTVEIRAQGGLLRLPGWQYEHEGCTIEFFPIPLNTSPLDEAEPGALGLYSHMRTSGGWGRSGRLRDAIFKKAKKYGNLGSPYVIAVNMVTPVTTRAEVSALFGTETLLWPSRRMTRSPDGAWGTHNKPRCHRVSGVLLFDRVLTWNVAKASCRLYHHPWAESPCPPPLTRLPQAFLRDGALHRPDGESLSTLFGLQATWPDDD